MTSTTVHTPVALSPTEILVDLIAGPIRAYLVGQPTAVIHDVLCARMRGLGLQPNELKVRRLAAWISAAATSPPPLDAA